MTIIRPFRFLLLVLVGAACVTGALAIFAACARAAVVMTDGIPAPVLVTPVTSGPDPSTVVVAWVGAILGGLSLLLTVAFQVLKVIAPLTKTRIDDEARDAIGEILNHVRGQSSTTVVVAQPAAPRDPQAGFASRLLLVVLAGTLVGAAVGFSVVGCAAHQRAAGARAFLECEGEHVDASLLEEAKKLAFSAVLKWLSGSGAIDATGLRAEAKPLKSDLMRCAMDGAMAALTAPAAPQPGAAMAAPMAVDAAQVRASWAQIRAELDWPAARSGG